MAPDPALIASPTLAQPASARCQQGVQLGWVSGYQSILPLLWLFIWQVGERWPQPKTQKTEGAPCIKPVCISIFCLHPLNTDKLWYLNRGAALNADVFGHYLHKFPHSVRGPAATTTHCFRNANNLGRRTCHCAHTCTSCTIQKRVADTYHCSDL